MTPPATTKHSLARCISGGQSERLLRLLGIILIWFLPQRSTPATGTRSDSVRLSGDHCGNSINTSAKTWQRTAAPRDTGTRVDFSHSELDATLVSNRHRLHPFFAPEVTRLDIIDALKPLHQHTYLACRPAPIGLMQKLAKPNIPWTNTKTLTLFGRSPTLTVDSFQVVFQRRCLPPVSIFSGVQSDISSTRWHCFLLDACWRNVRRWQMSRRLWVKSEIFRTGIVLSDWVAARFLCTCGVTWEKQTMTMCTKRKDLVKHNLCGDAHIHTRR